MIFYALLLLALAVPLGIAGKVAIALAFTIFWPTFISFYKYAGIPGPPPLPLVGNLLPDALRGQLHEAYLRWAKRYASSSGCFKWWPGLRCTVVLTDLDLVREVGLRKFSAFTNHIDPPAFAIDQRDEAMRNFSTKGLFGAKDSYWKGLRSTANSVLHNNDKLSGFMPAMKQTAEELADRLATVQPGESCDILKLIGLMTLVSACIISPRIAIRSADIKITGCDRSDCVRGALQRGCLHGRQRGGEGDAVVLPKQRPRADPQSLQDGAHDCPGPLPSYRLFRDALPHEDGP